MAAASGLLHGDLIMTFSYLVTDDSMLLIASSRRLLSNYYIASSIVVQWSLCGRTAVEREFNGSLV